MKRIAILSALTVLAASPVLAEPTTMSVTVRHDDLRLDHPRGQEQLERRIEQAARRVCGVDEPISGTRLRSASRVACYRQAQAAAMERYAAVVNDSALGG